jgi:membrane associated rhomboid family serine protease
MFIPIGDDNPTASRPIVNYALIAINVLVFLVTALTPDDPGLIRWMLVPARLQWPALFTSMFMHADVLHLLGNMVFLWIFGDNVEDRLGRIGYVIFYLVCGLSADAAHILSNPGSTVPTLGASGAISGVMGAYVLLFPRHHVRTFVWLWPWIAEVVRIPAFLWIGIWFVQQVLLNLFTHGGGVAYLAHIGGFVAGAAIGGVARVVADHWPSSGPRDEASDAKPPERRLFAPIPDDPGIEWMDDPADGYSVLRLADDPPDVAAIAQVAAAATGEPSADVARRLEATRGMVARAIPREAAGRIQRELQALGIPTAIILHGRSNSPPRPVAVEGASWDGRAIRLRAEDQIIMVPWSAPFLYVGARTEGRSFIDVFLNRRTAYRIADAREVPLTEVDPASRSEYSTDLAGFARAAIHRGGAAVNEGLRILAGGSGGGRLDFKLATDYDDYVFWLYNLTLAQGSRA